LILDNIIFHDNLHNQATLQSK